jgi:hypothetical protein
LPILLDQSCLKSLGNGFSTRSGVEFRQYRRDVMVNRSCGDEKTLGNVPLHEGDIAKNLDEKRMDVTDF